jgi:hypothetical protein
MWGRYWVKCDLLKSTGLCSSSITLGLSSTKTKRDLVLDQICGFLM